MNEPFQRTCIACNEKKHKNELIRIMQNEKGEISINAKDNQNGRGVYICNNIECLEKAKRTDKFGKVLRGKFDEEFYEKIRGVIIDNEQKKQTNS